MASTSPPPSIVTVKRPTEVIPVLASPASAASAPPLSSPAHASDAGESSDQSSTSATPDRRASPESDGTALKSSSTLSPPPEAAHKKSGSSIQIPPSRAHQLAQAAAATAAAGTAAIAAAPASTVRKSGSTSAPREKLHGYTRRFDQDYLLLRDCLLGSGASGSVYVCTSLRNPSHEYAVKIIAKAENNIDETAFYEEMKILAQIKHRNIIRLKDVYETDAEIQIVTELAYGGELFDRILKIRSFSEKDVVNLARKLFHAVAYLHSRGIVHRVSGSSYIHLFRGYIELHERDSASYGQHSD